MRLNCSTFHATIGFYIDSHAALVRRNCYKFLMNFWNIWNVWIFFTHACIYTIESRIELIIMAKLIGVCMLKGKRRGKNHGVAFSCMYMWYLLQRIWWPFGVYARMDFSCTCIHMCDWIEGRIMAKLMTPFHDIILLAIAWFIPLMFPKTLDIIYIYIYTHTHIILF